MLFNLKTTAKCLFSGKRKRQTVWTPDHTARRNSLIWINTVSKKPFADDFDWRFKG